MFAIVQKHKWISSFFIVVFLFLAVNVFLFPLFNSGDDVYLMYTLAGGYGEAPSNLLQYDHIWHPLLGWVLKTAFTWAPGINWYGLILQLFQALGCAAILYVFLRRFQARWAILLFLGFFILFEIRIVLSLNFSSTAWVLATGGLMLLLDESVLRQKRQNVFFAALLLLLSGLLRIQITLAVILLLLACFLIYAGKEYKRWAPPILAVVALLFLLNLQHKQFYRDHIPGWEKQEKIRQSLFYAYNRPLDKTKLWNQVFNDSIEKAFYFSNFFYDSSVFTAGRFAEIGKKLTRSRDFSVREDRLVFYWLFMDLRVYILAFIICFFIFGRTGTGRRTLWKWMIPAGGVVTVYIYLELFLKLTTAIHLGLLMLLCLYWILAIPTPAAFFSSTARKNSFLMLLFFLPLGWMGWRLIKTDRQNRQSHQRFECVIRELGQSPDKLFIATDDALPLDYCYVWDAPAKNKITNLVYKDRVLTQTYRPTLKRFGITDLLQAIYDDPRVFLLGAILPELRTYYQNKMKINVTISPQLPSFKCFEVRKVNAAEAGGKLFLY